MARPRTFDPDQVLDRARDLFWKNGFQGTSFDDITAATGLTKPSLFAAFGDKASLFLKVLDRYHQFLLSHSAEILSAGPSAREAIEAWFTSLLPFYSGSDGEKGCLSVNTLTDGALDDAALQRSVALFNSRLEDLILSRLKRDRGQFSDDFDPAAVARTVMAVYFGLMVMAKQTPSQKKVKSVIEQVRKMLT